MSQEQLGVNRQGLQQEPYATYHRLAKRDPALRVDLREQTRLYVFDRDERLLCWFLLDAVGRVISWANFWNGSINQHFYGPTADMGDVYLPKWGVSANGNYRFEYVSGRMLSRPIEPPSLSGAAGALGGAR